MGEDASQSGSPFAADQQPVLREELDHCDMNSQEAGGVGGAKNFSQILQALVSQPRNDQLIATMIIGPARGKPGSRPAVTKHVRTVTQIVTGTLFIPVIVTR